MRAVPFALNVPKSRTSAFVIHLCLSILVFSTLVAAMLVYWFPGKLFMMDGGWAGLKLVAMVDLVLGPALTLILFKPGKPGLKFDLSAIAAVQIAALAYGFYTTYNQRTVAVVFADNEFATVSAHDIKQANAALLERDVQPKPVPRAGAFDIPVLVTPAPENFGEYLADILNGFPSGHERSDLYVSINGPRDDMQPHVQPVEKLKEIGALPSIEKEINKFQLTLDEIEVYEFRARYANGYALFDPEKAVIVSYVNHTSTKSSDTVAENLE